MSLRNPIDWLRLYRRATAATRYANQEHVPGLEFADFGRRLGWRMIGRSPRLGARYLLTPVDILRHFEFEFAGGCLPSAPGACLDVSSPRLFSLYVAAKRPSTHITVLNPSREDLEETRAAVRQLALANIDTQLNEAAALRSHQGEYDAVWSLSVVEHIAGAYEDRQVVRWMFDALKPGGLLILTVPVDRRYWIEYREVDHYGTQTPTEDGKYFFQRFYDERALCGRLIESIGHAPVLTRWFGEKTPGRFHAYIARWMREGIAATVESPREIADHYQLFDSWQAMPGVGVAGLLFEKPR
jgi:SAM-dependent methyltransferase